MLHRWSQFVVLCMYMKSCFSQLLFRMTHTIQLIVTVQYTVLPHKPQCVKLNCLLARFVLYCLCVKFPLQVNSQFLAQHYILQRRCFLTHQRTPWAPGLNIARVSHHHNVYMYSKTSIIWPTLTPLQSLDKWLDVRWPVTQSLGLERFLALFCLALFVLSL